jgi:protocatechuate 3,4-dioxygenase beta subunit
MTDESTEWTDAGASPTRRTVVKAGIVGAAAVALTGTGVSAAAAAMPGEGKALTPSCDGTKTPRNVEGPFFKRNSPLRTNLVTGGVTGVYLTLTGKVLSPQCTPVTGALLEFWQADRAGAYDNASFTLRGHQFTNSTGDYTVDTVIPRDYRSGGTFRTPHLHVKVQAPNSTVLTSQLFFPDNTQAYGMDVAAFNRRDGLMNRACTITLGPLVNGKYTGTFEFVVPVLANRSPLK